MLASFAPLGAQSQPSVSHHLATLRTCGLAETLRDGQFNVYSLTERGRRLSHLAHTLQGTGDRLPVDMFRQAADPTRLQILRLLAVRRRQECRPTLRPLGDQSRPVSHHLAKLRDTGLVDPKRDGKFSFYGLTDTGLRLSEAVMAIIE